MTPAPELSPERLAEIVETYRALGIDVVMPATHSTLLADQLPPKVVVIPMLSNNSSFD